MTYIALGHIISVQLFYQWFLGCCGCHDNTEVEAASIMYVCMYSLQTHLVLFVKGLGMTVEVRTYVSCVYSGHLCEMTSVLSYN